MKKPDLERLKKITLFDEEWIAKMHERSVREEGTEEGLLKAIGNMVKNLRLTVEQAIVAAGVPEAERAKYLKILSL